MSGGRESRSEAIRGGVEVEEEEDEENRCCIAIGVMEVSAE